MIYYPPKEKYTYEDLLEIIRLLRSPEGCPWDKVQTHESIRRGLLEEAYEAAETIDRDDPAGMCEELGDLLMQVVFHADIEKEAGRFTMDDVCDGVVKKLVYRHPHVFSVTDTKNDTPDEVLINWEELKKKEKGYTTTGEAMAAVAKSLPATWRAEKIQKKAANEGFDWPDVNRAMDKLREEVQELEEAIREKSNYAEELGDLLFAAVKVARFLKADPEEVLHAACDKFTRRFSEMEAKNLKTARNFKDLGLDEMAILWENTKCSEEKVETRIDLKESKTMEDYT